MHNEPVTAINDATIVRMLVDAYNSGQPTFSKHPEDFILFKVAEYHDHDGTIIPMEVPEKIMHFTEIKVLANQGKIET